MKPRERVELRIDIAELLGWTLWGGSPRGTPFLDMRWCVPGKSGDFNFYCPPDWPSDLNACEHLINFLADRGWTCRIENGLDKTWECTFETGTSGHKDFKQHYVPDDNLSITICRAFVAAMKADSEPASSSR